MDYPIGLICPSVALEFVSTWLNLHVTLSGQA